MAISMPGKNRFAKMVVYYIGMVGRQCAWLYWWWLPSMEAENQSSWLPFDAISKVLRSGEHEELMYLPTYLGTIGTYGTYDTYVPSTYLSYLSR